MTSNFFDNITLPDPEEIFNKRSAGFAELIASDTLFNTISLTEWLKFAAKAGIPYVPSRIVANLALSSLLRFDEPEFAENPVLKEYLAVTQNVPEDHMIRWDCCSSLALKLAMDTGQGAVEAMRTLYLDDPRAFDILFEFPQETVDVHYRPWVEAAYTGTHPVEYRVYVEDDEIIGISNYYPQRDLPVNNKAVEKDITLCRNYTQKLIDTLKKDNKLPWMPRYRDAELSSTGIHFTADFILDGFGQLQFLEAGPAWKAGAHPCCFEGKPVSGVALSKNNDPIPFTG